MQIIIEIDGPVLDVAPAWYEAHRAAVADVQWAALDQPTFWRLIRTHGVEAPVLRGAKPMKLKKYHARFAQRIETNAVWEAVEPQEEIDRTLADLSAKARLTFVTTGSNLDARRPALDRARLPRMMTHVEPMDSDPAARVALLRSITVEKGRALLAGASDALLGAARDADLVVIGIANGPCTRERLYRAGADIVYRNLPDLLEAIRFGADELHRAGLRPPELG